MNLRSASFYTILGLCIKLGSLLVINKIMAEYLTLEEYGAFGKYQAIFQLLSTAAILGMSTGITKLIARYDNNNKIINIVISEIQKIFVTSIILLIIILIINFDKIFAVVINNILEGYKKYVIILTLISLPIATMSIITSSIYSGKLLIRKNIFANSLSSIISLLIAVPLISEYKLTGAILVFLAYSTLPLIITYKNTSLFQVKKYKNLYKNKIIRSTLFKYSIAALASIFAMPLFQIYARYELENYNMNELIGIWQGIIRISDLTIILPAAIVGNYFLPKISQIRSEKEIIHEVLKTSYTLIPIYTTFILILLIFKENFIEILFSNKYSEMTKGIKYQLFGDIIRLPIMMFTMLFLAKGRILKFIILELSSPFIQLILLKIYGNNINITAITCNYLISLVIVVIFLTMYIIKCKNNSISWV